MRQQQKKLRGDETLELSIGGTDQEPMAMGRMKTAEPAELKVLKEKDLFGR